MAVFYDMQNVSLRTHGVERIHQLIGESLLADRIVLQRAYTVRNKNTDYGEMEEELGAHGISLVVMEERRSHQGKTKPNQVDLKMCADIPAAVLRRRSITTVTLVTGDGDFCYLSELLREQGKQVLVVSDGNHTSQDLIEFCDDWVDLSGSSPPDKTVRQIWQTRMRGWRNPSPDFLVSFLAFLEDSGRDPLLHRFLRQGVTLQLLLSIYPTFGSVPQYNQLGFRSWTDFMAFALEGTAYRAVQEPGSHPRLELAEMDNPLPPDGRAAALYRRMAGMDGGYSPGRMRQWLKNLSRHSERQFNELLYYVGFLRDNGLLEQDGDGMYCLPTPEDYPARMTEQLRKKLRSAGYTADEEVLRHLEDSFIFGWIQEARSFLAPDPEGPG